MLYLFDCLIKARNRSRFGCESKLKRKKKHILQNLSPLVYQKSNHVNDHRTIFKFAIFKQWYTENLSGQVVNKSNSENDLLLDF